MSARRFVARLSALSIPVVLVFFLAQTAIELRHAERRADVLVTALENANTTAKASHDQAVRLRRYLVLLNDRIVALGGQGTVIPVVPPFQPSTTVPKKKLPAKKKAPTRRTTPTTTRPAPPNTPPPAPPTTACVVSAPVTLPTCPGLP